MTRGALRATQQLKSRSTKGWKKKGKSSFLWLVSGSERGEESVQREKL